MRTQLSTKFRACCDRLAAPREYWPDRSRPTQALLFNFQWLACAGATATRDAGTSWMRECRAKAYARAADNLLALSLPLDQIIVKGGLREIPGIGDAIADIRAVSNPYTTILGHMTGRQLLRRL
jgi:hypothetical protein